MTALKDQEFLALLTLGQEVERASVRIENEAGSVSGARHFVREQLAAWGSPAADDFTDRVVLTVSELVTNSVIHARTRPPNETELIEIALSWLPGFALGVSVSDNSNAVPLPAVRTPDSATHGRGLILVGALADGWIAAPRESADGTSGKGVWAFFRCSGSMDCCHGQAD